jgi:ribosomal protein S18 acetylase RimI-like enzyme
MSDIRILNSSDLDQIRCLRLQGVLESPAAFGQSVDEFKQMSDAELLSWIGPTDDKFVVGAISLDGTLVGMMGLTREPCLRTRHKAKLWGVYVRPESRGSGISRQLLRYLLDNVSRLPGLRQINLAVATPQVAAQTLYRSFGFIEFGIEPCAIAVEEGFIDEVHMYLRLTA